MAIVLVHAFLGVELVFLFCSRDSFLQFQSGGFLSFFVFPCKRPSVMWVTYYVYYMNLHTALLLAVSLIVYVVLLQFRFFSIGWSE